MKIIYLLLILLIFPLYTPQSNIRASVVVSAHQESRLLPNPLVKKKKRKKRQQKTKRKKARQARKMRKINNRVPPYAAMLGVGVGLIGFGTFAMILGLVFATSGLGAALAFSFGLIFLILGLILAIIAAIFVAKGLRENRSFRTIHQKTIREMSAEVRAEADKKVDAFLKKERRQYIQAKMRIYKLQADIVLQEQKGTAAAKNIIARKQQAIEKQQQLIADIEKKVKSIEEQRKARK